MPFLYHLDILVPGPDWIVTVESIPQRGLMKLERSGTGSEALVKVYFSSAADTQAGRKFDCSLDSTALLIVARGPGGERTEKRLTIAEDMEPIPGKRRQFRTKVRIVMQAPPAAAK